MGQEQGKYHVSKDGKVYRINEDGSFTELGNAEDLNKPKQESSKTNHPKRNSYKPLWIILAVIVIALIGFVILWIASSNSHNDYINSETTTDSVSYGVISNEVVDENPDFDEWRRHAYDYIQELIASPSKSLYDSPNYSATDSRISAAIDMFYDNKYAEVEKNMFYPAYRQNNATAQYYLGCIYANGDHGIKKDNKTAFFWFEQAANNGYVKAMYYLARDYYRNKDDIRYWMQKAADNGDMEARYFGMAHSYEDGSFTEIDLHKALQLYEEFARDYGNDYWLVGEDIARVKNKLGIK